MQRWWDGSQWRGEGAAVGPPSSSTPDGFAVASFVTALLFIPFVPVYLGLRARTRIRESGGTKDGYGLAMLGVGLGLVQIAAAAVAGLVVLL